MNLLDRVINTWIFYNKDTYQIVKINEVATNEITYDNKQEN